MKLMSYAGFALIGWKVIVWLHSPAPYQSPYIDAPAAQVATAQVAATPAPISTPQVPRWITSEKVTGYGGLNVSSPLFGYKFGVPRQGARVELVAPHWLCAYPTDVEKANTLSTSGMSNGAVESATSCLPVARGIEGVISSSISDYLQEFTFESDGKIVSGWSELRLGLAVKD
jgi:hypothetical protein